MRLNLSNLVLLGQAIILLSILHDHLGDHGHSLSHSHFHVEAIASNEKFNKRIKKFASSSPPLVSGARAPISFSIFGGGGGRSSGSGSDSDNKIQEEEEKEEEEENGDDAVVGEKDEEDDKSEVVVVEKDIVIEGEVVTGNDDQNETETETETEKETEAENDAALIDTAAIDDGNSDENVIDNGDVISTTTVAASGVPPPALNLGEEKSDFFHEEDVQVHGNIDDENSNNSSSNNNAEIETKTCSTNAVASAASIHAQKQLGRVAVPALLAGGSLIGVSRIFSPTSESSSSPPTRKASIAAMMTGNANTNGNMNAMKGSNNKNDQVSDELAPMITILKVAFACLIASKI